MDDILLVCTGNQCRSPVGAELLRIRLEAQGVRARVHSAGLHIRERTMNDDLVRALRDRGIDLSGHRSHGLARDDVQRADLILTMEHHQVGDVALLDPTAWSRTFTFKEIVRRSATAGQRAPDEPLDRWLARVGARRTRLELVGAWRDDIADPAGGSLFEVERTVDELDDLTARLVDLAWPRAGGRRRRAGRRGSRPLDGPNGAGGGPRR